MKIEVKQTAKLVNYSHAIQFLEKRVSEVLIGKKSELLWILEHEPVFTAGTNYKENEIINKSINLIKTSRGGKITYHGPGQKIVYLVLDLNKRGKDIRKFINKIEDCIIQILNEFSIKSFRDKKNIGIWVNSENEEKKIAAIGIKVKRWIAFHGFCINVNTNLQEYENIIPCGISNKGVTNLNEVNKINYNKINDVIIKNFLNIFEKI